MVIETDPNDAHPYNNRGMCYENIGQHDKAISDYNKALEIDPNYAKAYDNRGTLYREIGQIEKACADWKRACDLGECSRYNGAKSDGDCE